MIKYQVPQLVLAETFQIFRRCGAGQCECQALWVSAWHSPANITAVVHPRHRASSVSVQVDSAWIGEFWQDLAAENSGIRVQVHSHPGRAFHSATDDAYPIIHQPGFLSLVIPSYGLGPVGFDGAHLTEITPDGGWKGVPIENRLKVL